MNYHGQHYKPVCKSVEPSCEPKCEPVCKPEPKCEPVCEPVCEPKCKTKGAGSAGWLSLIGVGILIFILVLITLWVADPRGLRKKDGDHCSDDRDIVKYIVISLLIAIIAVILVGFTAAAAAAGCKMLSDC